MICSNLMQLLLKVINWWCQRTLPLAKLAAHTNHILPCFLSRGTSC